MLTWTPTAQTILARSLQQARLRAIESGADPDEVEADLQRHVEAELNGSQTVVNQADVERVLTRLGLAQETAALENKPLAEPSGQLPENEAEKIPLHGGFNRGLIWFFGVVLPLITVGFEFGMRACRETLIDPIPTWLHILAIVSVALINGFTLCKKAVENTNTLRRNLIWNSWAIGVAGVYALAFAYITPFAFIGIIVFGLGLIPLGPLSALICAGLLRRRLRYFAREAQVSIRPWWHGALVAVGVLAIFEVPNFVTFKALQKAEVDPAAAGWHLSWLRHWDWADEFEGRWNGAHSTTAGGWLAEKFSEPLKTATPPQALFHAKGEDEPMLLQRRRGWNRWDSKLGTDQVGGVLYNLFCTDSRLDGVIDAQAAHGYVEWTMVFRNENEFGSQEARCVIALPSGGVVSRLTLWINGEEHEAAWGGRSQTTAAYQKVAIQQRRDPVLVTAAGPDRVLLQCFPVQPKKEMKVRVGITFPLQLPEGVTGRFRVPSLVEQNFAPAQHLKHKTWFESWGRISSAYGNFKVEPAEQPGSYALRGEIEAAELGADSLCFTVDRSPKANFTWTEALDDQTSVCTQRLVEVTSSARSFVVVVDGSASMRNVISKLCAALKAASGVKLQGLWLAGDTLVQCPERDAPLVGAWLAQQSFVGGQDSSDALAAAADALVAAPEGGAILWVHGPQPMSWQNNSTLSQILERRPGKIHVIDAALAAGRNVLVPQVSDNRAWLALSRCDTLEADLTRTLRYAQSTAHITPIRELVQRQTVTLDSSQRTTTHLRRLWANDEVNRLYSPSDFAAASALAVKHQIVTMVSGAVVLETKQQYDDAGLKQGAHSASPATPEPATYGIVAALILCGLIAVKRWKTRRT